MQNPVTAWNFPKGTFQTVPEAVADPAFPTEGPSHPVNLAQPRYTKLMHAFLMAEKACVNLGCVCLNYRDCVTFQRTGPKGAGSPGKADLLHGVNDLREMEGNGPFCTFCTRKGHDITNCYFLFFQK